MAVARWYGEGSNLEKIKKHKPNTIMNHIKSTIILVLLTTFKLTAQTYKNQDYIVDIQNDTLVGTIKEKSKTLIFFTPRNKDIQQIFTVKQVKSYVIDNIPRIVADIKTDSNAASYFVKVRIKGYVNLFEMIKSDTTFQFIIQLPDKSLIPLLNGNQPWGVLRNYLSGCENDYFKKIMLQKYYGYSLAYFSNIIEEYNKCMQPKQYNITYKKRLDYAYGIYAGYASNGWTYSFNLSNPYYNANGPLSSSSQIPTGLFFNLFPDKRLSYNLEVLYIQYQGSSTTPVILNGTKIADYNIVVNEKYLTIPVQLKYAILFKTPLKLYVKAGATFNYDLDFVVQRYRSGSGIEDNFVSGKVIGAGYAMGLGLEKRIFKNNKIFAEARYLTRGVYEGITPLGSTNSFQVVVGFGILKKK
jgi:hypothetical protein